VTSDKWQETETAGRRLSNFSRQLSAISYQQDGKSFWLKAAS